MDEGKRRFAVRLLPPAQYDLEQIAQLYLSLSGAASARRIIAMKYPR